MQALRICFLKALTDSKFRILLSLSITVDGKKEISEIFMFNIK